MTEGAAPRTSTKFGPVVLAGLGTAALAAVAGTKPWIGSGASAPTSADASMLGDQATTYPLATALALVLLAAWGVLLVTRGGVRRAFAWLALLAALGTVAAVVAGYVDLRDATASSYDQLMGRSRGDRGFTGWFWTAAVAAVLALVPAVLATRLAGSWPEMGRRYDAPGAGAPTGEPQTERELWAELDEGRDPTTD